MMYGTFIYLPMDFIKKNRPPRGISENSGLPFEKIKWGKDWIYITYNGFIGCSNSNLEICTKKINTILFSITLLYRPRNSISELDLNPFTIDNSSNTLSSDEFHLTSINHVYYLNSDFRDPGVPTPLVTKKELDKIIEFAKQLYKSSNFIWQIAFYNGWSRYDLKEYPESFVFNWLVIEAYVRNKIRNYYKNEKSVTNNEVLDELVRRQLKFLINICKHKKLIEPTLLKKIDKMRDIRNKVMHGTSQVTQKRAEKCKLIANKIFWENLTEAGIKYNQYKI